MIFLTLGTQLPFERLVQAVDVAAGQLDEPIFGQIGTSSYVPKYMEYKDCLTPAEFREKFSAARVIVGHAGMGTILSARSSGKPLLIMARKASLGEHRNDHQLATLAQMRSTPGIHVLKDDTDLVSLLTKPDLPAMSDTESPNRTRLITRLRSEIAKTVARP